MITNTLPKSLFADAETIPRDSIFEVTKRFNEDTSPDKINLSQGTYRDEHGQPWILPSVRMAQEAIGEPGHEYLPIAGSKPLRDEAVKLVFEGTKAYEEKRVRDSTGQRKALTDHSRLPLANLSRAPAPCFLRHLLLKKSARQCAPSTLRIRLGQITSFCFLLKISKSESFLTAARTGVSTSSRISPLCKQLSRFRLWCSTRVLTTRQATTLLRHNGKILLQPS